MGELMEALIKYADSDNTRDPRSDEEKSNKGKKNGNGKGQQQNMTGHNQGNNGKRKQTDGGSDFVANTNAQNNNQRRKGNLPQFRGPKLNLEAMLNEPCLKHSFSNR